MKVDYEYYDMNYDICDSYIISNVEGVKKPFIEKYLLYKDIIVNILEKNDNVLSATLWEDDVNYDYDFYITLKNIDIQSEILKLSKQLNCISINLHVDNNQIEDSINENDDFVSFDLFCNIDM